VLSHEHLGLTPLTLGAYTTNTYGVFGGVPLTFSGVPH
jgi:hypothetical protein